MNRNSYYRNDFPSAFAPSPFAFSLVAFSLIASSRLFFSFFLRLQRFPVSQYFRRCIGLHIPEHVRMPIHQLVGKPVEHVVYRKVAVLRAISE